jgi:L-ascorbate metabolism protein UlaG (beta-lactamase superfamily)
MAALTITRILHSSVLLDFDGSTILTDPWFSERPGYYHGEPYGVALGNLPPLVGVVSSHAHYDHFDMEAFQAYPDKAMPMVVKRDRGRMARLARNAGFTTIVELEPWESTMLGPIKVTAAPAAHSVPEITYLLEAHALTVYFGGDTLLIPELREIPVRFPHIDVALLPVNGLEIRPAFNRKVVMDAREAAELCAILQPRYAVPVHYTFTAGPLRDRLLLKYTGTAEDFAEATARRAPATTVRILAPGEPLVVQALETPAPSSGPTAALA